MAFTVFARGGRHQPRAVEADGAGAGAHPQAVGHKHGAQRQEKDPQAQRSGRVSPEQ